MIAHNGSGFDFHIVLNKLPQWRRVVSMIRNGAGPISLKTCNGYVDKNNKIGQKVHSTCGRIHIKKN